MNSIEIKRRARELEQLARHKTVQYEHGEIGKKDYNAWVDQAYRETQHLAEQAELVAKAGRVMGAQEAAFGGNVGTPATKAFGVGSGPRPPSPMDATPAQISALWKAATHKTPFSLDVGKADGFENVWGGGITTKSPVFESGIGGGFSGNLPPVQTPFAVGIGYEPTRIASLLPGAAMPGPSATWLSHTADAAEASATAEGGTKPDIGPTIVENQVIPAKIAGLVGLSLEAWQDTDSYGEGAFSAWLPSELTRSLINAESNYLLNAGVSGGPTGATFKGLLAVSGTLTREVGTDTPLDALNEAYIDLRVGSAFANPDLVIMHPSTLGALRREKDSEGRYLLNLLAGPIGLTSDGQAPTLRPADEPNAYSIVPQAAPQLSGDLWGAPIAITTQCPAGTAIVMSVAAGGGIFWQRLGLRLEFNMWASDMWTENTYSFRAEERVALSVPRPSAVNIVTGLPTS